MKRSASDNDLFIKELFEAALWSEPSFSARSVMGRCEKKGDDERSQVAGSREWPLWLLHSGLSEAANQPVSRTGLYTDFT